eukprot:2081236-Alexandrium_andersonii.AAC.1
MKSEPCADTKLRAGPEGRPGGPHGVRGSRNGPFSGGLPSFRGPGRAIRELGHIKRRPLRSSDCHEVPRIRKHKPWPLSLKGCSSTVVPPESGGPRDALNSGKLLPIKGLSAPW